MIDANKLKFTLPPGYWQYWFRDKETLTPLSPRQHVIKDPTITCEVEIDVPEHLMGNKAASIFITRVR